MACSMEQMGELTALLTRDPVDSRALHLYARSKKMDADDLLRLVVVYGRFKHEKFLPNMSLLHLACISCKPDVVKVLLKEGWDVNLESPDAGLPLHVALDTGNISVARLLIESGADLRRISSADITPLGSALSTNKRQRNCVSAVKLMLEAGVSVNGPVDYVNYNSALHIAATTNLTSVVSLLLQREADINIANLHHATPLLLAVSHKHIDVVKLLLHHEPDLYAQDKNQTSPMIAAVKNKQKEVLEMLVTAGCDVDRPVEDYSTNPLHTAVVICDLDIVRQLLNLNADPNKKLNNATPLHLIGCRKTPAGVSVGKQFSQDIVPRKDIAEALIDSGARVDSLNGSSLTPLQVALHNGLLSVAQVLIKSGADVNVGATSDTSKALGNSLFHQIVQMDRDVIISFLENGADFTVRNTNRMTPYHCAIFYNIEVNYIKFFLINGCPYNQDIPVWTKAIKNCSQEKQKFFAAEETLIKGMLQNDLNCVKTAIEQGAVPSSVCEELRFPLHFLASKGYSDILEYLLEQNVSPNRLNDKGESVLYIAAKNGHFNICCSLLSHGASYNYASRASDCRAQTPYAAAYENHHKQIIDLLINIKRMFMLCQRGSKRLIQELQLLFDKSSCEGFLYLNAINRNGYSLLGSAIQKKHKFLVESLIKFQLTNPAN